MDFGGHYREEMAQYHMKDPTQHNQNRQTSRRDSQTNPNDITDVVPKLLSKHYPPITQATDPRHTQRNDKSRSKHNIDDRRQDGDSNW